MLPNVLQPREADHVPVLAEEVRAALAVRPGETVIDATFGAGGHAAILAADLRGKGKLIAIDRDPTARTYFEQLAKRATVHARLLRGGFGVVLPQLAGNGVQADAILLDLGVSSMQLDRPERGFSYSADAPLDMRMDSDAPLTAAEVLNTWDAKALTRSRCLVDAARPSGTGLLLLCRRPPGHADGFRRPADRGRGAQHLGREGPDPISVSRRCSSTVRNGASPTLPTPPWTCGWIPTPR